LGIRDGRPVPRNCICRSFLAQDKINRHDDPQYNETVNDLLGKSEFDKKKHEIKHCTKTGTTRVTDVNVVPLHSATQVRSLLAQAQSRRTVAATLINERSSRSHSVFTLRIVGVNKSSGEQCEGSLNLVDLAGSERLNVSGTGADRDRLKETQNINKSLSALGDVIAALGEKSDKGEKHIPYRNSKVDFSALFTCVYRSLNTYNE